MVDFPQFSRRRLLASTLAAAALGAVAPSSGAAAIPTSTRELWQWVRTQPVLDLSSAYLDAANAGPTLRAAMAAEYRARDAHSFALASFDQARWTAETNRLIERASLFLGCARDELQFTTGAGDALAQVANGLDLAQGDEIITTQREHPAALSPWLMLARRRGVVVKQIELPAPLSGPEQVLGLFAGAVTERTRALLFSHINYSDGAVAPVRELCDFARQRGLISIVDGAQALGMVDLSLTNLNCDFYATSFHKWLGGCRGAGALYVRRDALERLWPAAPRSVQASPPIYTPTTAQGHQDVPAAIDKLGNITPLIWSTLRGMEAAMELQQQIGRARIEARVRELAIYTRLRLQQLPDVEILTPASPGFWAGILTFRSAKRNAADLALSLARGHRVHVHALAWPDSDAGAVRTSLHIYNTHDEVEQLLRGLTQALR